MKYYSFAEFAFTDEGLSTSVTARGVDGVSIYHDVSVAAVEDAAAAEFEAAQDSRIGLSKITKTQANKLLANSAIYKRELEALEDAKKHFLKVLNEQFEAAVARLHDSTPSSEIASWSYQEKEARAYKLDASAPTPYIDAISTERGIDKAVMVDKVIAKADAYVALSAALIAKRQRYEDECKAASTLAQLQDISVEF